MSGERRTAASSVDLALLALVVAGLAYACRVFLGGYPVVIDFNAIWVAGRVWLLGQNAYGPEFARMGATVPSETVPPLLWLYPPHFWWIAILYGLPGAKAGLLAWRLQTLLLAGLSAALLGATFGRTARGRWRLGAAVGIYLLWMTATGGALGVGQVGFLPLLGLALAGWGIAREREAATVAGFVILMLKPQLGLVACGAALALPGAWKTLAKAALLVVLLSIPPLVASGVPAVVQGFAAHLPAYRSIAYNLPIAMTGIANLVARGGGVDLPAVGLSLLGAALAPALLFLLRRRRGDEASGAAADYLLVSCAAILLLVPLHIYDLEIAGCLVALLPRLAPPARWAVLAGLALMMRPENLAGLVPAHTDTVAATVASLGCLLVAVALVAEIVAVRSRRTSSR